jgi:hypothetical protein
MELRAYDASVGIGPQNLRLAVEVVLLWSPGEGNRFSSLVVAKDYVINTRCEGILMARMDSPLE